MSDHLERDGTDHDEDVASAGGSRIRRVALLSALVVAAAAIVGVVVLLGGDDEPPGDPRSAAEGAEGTRTFDGLPVEIPAVVLPGDVDEQNVNGEVSRIEGSWAAAATFDTRGDHDELARGGDEPLFEQGFTLRQRAFDEVSMIVIYDHPDGSVLRVTYEATGEADGVRVTAVRTRS